MDDRPFVMIRFEEDERRGAVDRNDGRDCGVDPRPVARNEPPDCGRENDRLDPEKALLRGEEKDPDGRA